MEGRSEETKPHDPGLDGGRKKPHPNKIGFTQAKNKRGTEKTQGEGRGGLSGANGKRRA